MAQKVQIYTITAHTSAVVEGTALVCDIQTRLFVKNRVCMSHTSAVPSTTVLVCASNFLKMTAAIRCCPMPKCYQNKSRFPIQHNSIQNSKSNISNTIHTKFKFQVSTNTRILSKDTNIINIK